MVQRGIYFTFVLYSNTKLTKYPMDQVIIKYYFKKICSEIIWLSELCFVSTKYLSFVSNEFEILLHLFLCIIFPTCAVAFKSICQNCLLYLVWCNYKYEGPKYFVASQSGNNNSFLNFCVFLLKIVRFSNSFKGCLLKTWLVRF